MTIEPSCAVVQDITEIAGFETAEYKTLKVEATETRYFVAASQLSIDRKIAMVFIPGWGGIAEFWHHQLRHFLDSYTLIAMDYPGCGQSKLCDVDVASGQQCFSLKDQANLVNQILEQESIETCFMVGHSMGGALCLELAVMQPSKVSAVIGVDTFTYMDLYPRQSLAAAKAFTDSLSSDYQNNVKALAASYIEDDSNRELIRWASDTMAGTDQATGLMLLEEFVVWDLKKALSQYPGPVNTINAALRYEGAKFEEEFGSQIEVSLVHNCGHFVMLEQATAFNHRLEQVLSGL